MEIVGLIIALLGIVIVFDTPRKWIATQFSRKKANPTGPSLADDEPTSLHAIILYVNSSAKPLNLDNDIALNTSSTVDPFVGDGRWLHDMVTALNICTMGQLDELVAQHTPHAKLLAHAILSEHQKIRRGHGLSLVLEIEAMQRYGSEWYEKFIKSLKLTSSSKGFADEMYSFYTTVRRSRA
jgi:hypothetical protein